VHGGYHFGPLFTVRTRTGNNNFGCARYRACARGITPSHKRATMGIGLRGSRTFRSPVFSLLGAKVPTENICSLERKFPGTFVPKSDILGSELYE